MLKQYRACVLAVIVDDRNNILVGERSDRRGSWQMPQGGIEPGEKPIDALYRELSEEIGCNDIELINEIDEQISYDFPAHFSGDIMKKYAGQSQTWFLARLKAGVHTDLSKTLGEFSDLDWKSAEKVLEGIVDWKKEAYRKGLYAFGLLKEI